MLSFDDWVDIEFEVQESLWRNWEEAQRDYPELVALGWLCEPHGYSPRRTRESIEVDMLRRTILHRTFHKLTPGTRKVMERLSRS